MKKSDYQDGICDNCGNTGLAGERCVNCGEILAKIEPETMDTLIDDDGAKNEPEVYPLEVLDEEKDADDFATE